MKKISSLFLVVLLMLSLSVTAFAKPEATGTANLKTIYTATSEGITVDIYVSNLTDAMEVKHQLNLATSQVTYVENSLTYSDKIAGWDNVSVDQGSAKITFYAGTTSDAKAISVSSEELLASYKLTVVSGVTLEKSDFAYFTGTSYLKKCYYMDKTATEYFFATQEYDYVTGGGNTSWKDTVTETNPDNYTESIKFPTASNGGQDGVAGDVTRKTVMFAKNTTGAELAAGSYGIKVGEFFYPGKAPVLADQYWSIILLTTEADRGLKNETYAADAIINYGTEAEESQSITLNVK